MKATVASSLLFTSLAFAANIEVQVGPGLNFSPEEVTAAEGDVIRFNFGSGHDVVQGSFDSPCQAIDGGIYSGNPQDGEVFNVRINNTDPIWIYCSIPGHCQQGMAMVINPPSSGNTLDAYLQAARNVDESSTPSAISGGTFGDVSEDTSAATSASAASTSAAALSTSASQASESAASTSAAATATTSEEAGSTTSESASASSTGNADGGVGNLVTPLSLIAGAFVGALALVL